MVVDLGVLLWQDGWVDGHPHHHSPTRTRVSVLSTHRTNQSIDQPTNQPNFNQVRSAYGASLPVYKCLKGSGGSSGSSNGLREIEDGA